MNAIIVPRHGTTLQRGRDHSKRLGVKLLVAPAGRPIPEKAQLPTDLATHVKSGETIKMDGYTMKPQ